MSWLSTFGIGFINAIIGVFGVGTLASLCVEWHRIPNREGGSTYFAILVGLLGGVIAFVIGVTGARMIAASGEPGFFKGLLVVTGSSVALLLVATLLCWLTADFATTLRGKPVELQAELRCPVGFVIPDDATDEHWYAQIDTRSRQATSRAALRLDEARNEDGHLIIPMTLDLLTSVREKLLHVRLAENGQHFIATFPSKPGQRLFAWSEWQYDRQASEKTNAEEARGFTLRFRLQVVESPAELEMKKQAADASTLAALTPDSPLEDSLRFTHYSHSEDQRRMAGVVIARRPDVVAEMSAQILSPDRETADRALRALPYLKPLPVELAAPVASVGETVVAALEKFNATKPEEDPNGHSVSEVAQLFSGWFEAHQALHEVAGVDGLSQLERVLALSQHRDDSQAARTDIPRVAQFYVTKWSQLLAER